MGVVGVLVSNQHAIEPIDLGIEQLAAQVRRGVDEQARYSAVLGDLLDEQRASSAPVLGIARVASTPAKRDPGNAHRGAAAEDGEAPRHVAARSDRGTFANSRKKLSVVIRAISSVETLRAVASTLAVSTTNDGSLRLPR